jgi:hypothetical protein
MKVEINVKPFPTYSGEPCTITIEGSVEIVDKVLDVLFNSEENKIFE